MAEEMDYPLLLPRIERVVEFYGDLIPVAVVGDEAYVPLRMLTDFLGLNWSGQRQRLLRDEVLERHVRLVKVTAADGKQYEMICLELSYLPGWLFGVTASRVRDALQDKLTRYREECFKVLWQSFQTDLVRTASTPGMPLEQVRGLALAIATLAEQQMALEGRVNQAGELATLALARLDRAAEVVGTLQRRLATVESRITPASYITDEQAVEVSTQVKALAELLTGKDSNKNHYQGIFSELYRRFGVSSYKLIRQEQYEVVLKFLDDWRKAITEAGP